MSLLKKLRDLPELTSPTDDTMVYAVDGSEDHKLKNLGLKNLLGMADSQLGIERYNKIQWSNLTDFTTTGAAASIVNGSIRIGTAYGSWDTQRLMINSSINNDRDWVISASIRIRDMLQYGMAFGITSINPWDGHSLAVALNPSGLSTAIYPEFSGANTAPIGTGVITSVAINDILNIRISSKRSLVTTTVTNVTTNLSASFSAYKDKNTGRAGFASLGSGIDILSLNFRADCMENPQIITIGDSKTAGTLKDNYSSWADRIRPERNIRIFAGPSDRTVEAVQCLPNFLGSGASYAIMCIGRNDWASGVDDATRKANYQTIVSALKAEGITVIHLVIPETIQDQTALKAWLDVTYPSDTREYLSGWVHGTHLSNDNVHPNATGSAYIASIIETLLPSPPIRSGIQIAYGNRLSPEISKSSLFSFAPFPVCSSDADANARLISGDCYTITGSTVVHQKP